MFLCQNCKNPMELPACSCGYTVRRQNGIWQLSDMPDSVVEGEGDRYIGYQHIGENYSGGRRYVMEERDARFAKEVSQMTGKGILLDLACGDGCLAVPCAANGTKIIAGDISNNMLSILQKKAAYNGISIENVTLCRMNALDIPLRDESVHTVVADSMLHLVSNPRKVIHEIYRVLRKGGSFICRDDRPGKSGDSTFDNTKYNEFVNGFYSEYWRRLNTYDVFPTKYSWKFDREGFCDSLFASKREKMIERGNYYEIALKDGFLPRFCNRGFSDQVDVPVELHDSVIAELLAESKDRFGEGFADILYKGVEDDLLITAYTK